MPQKRKPAESSFLCRAPADRLEVAKAAWNNIAWGLMGVSDNLYNEYSANLFSPKGAIGIDGDTASVGLTAAAAIAHLAGTRRQSVR
jgi:hypothetical protein